jgi:hypothetical protein
MNKLSLIMKNELKITYDKHNLRQKTKIPNKNNPYQYFPVDPIYFLYLNHNPDTFDFLDLMERPESSEHPELLEMVNIEQFEHGGKQDQELQFLPVGLQIPCFTTVQTIGL